MTANSLVIADSPTSWTEVLATHARWLRTVVLARLGETQAVDDVMQEIAVAVSRALERAHQRVEVAPRAWGPWLYRVAVRQTLLYRRRIGRQRRLHEAMIAGAGRTGGRDAHDRANPLTWLLREERDELIRSAVRRLPPRDAQTLMLKHGEGWTYAQIAEQLGVSPKAVETRLVRARAKLRAALQDVAEH